MRSVIGQDPSSIQVWWKDVQYFLCNADELTNHPTNKRTSGTTSLAEVKKKKKKSASPAVAGAILYREETSVIIKDTQDASRGFLGFTNA